MYPKDSVPLGPQETTGITVSANREVTGTQSLARDLRTVWAVRKAEKADMREGGLLSCLQRSMGKAISVQNGKSPLHCSLRETDATSSGYSHVFLPELNHADCIGEGRDDALTEPVLSSPQPLPPPITSPP